MIPEDYQQKRKMIRHKSSRMDEKMASPSRRRKTIEKKHDWNAIDRKERQRENRARYHHRSPQIYSTSHKVNAAKKAGKKQRAEQHEQSKAREMTTGKNYNNVSGLVTRHFVWCRENLFPLECNVTLSLSL